MTDREAFVLDDDDLDGEEQTRNCRLILGVLAGDADSFETDIPNGRSGDKPGVVIEAAERLFRATGRARCPVHHLAPPRGLHRLG